MIYQSSAGLISCSIVFGLALSKLQKEENIRLLISVILAINETFMCIIRYALWTTPLGIGSLICGNIIKFAGASEVGVMIAIYTGTVLCGLLIHVLFVLPLIFWVMTKDNPFRLDITNHNIFIFIYRTISFTF